MIEQENIEIDNSIFDFIRKHINDEPSQLMLKYRDKMDREALDFAVTQIEARRRTAHKLPTFNAIDEFIYPHILSSEQATHEEVAIFHASLIDENENVADLTAGLGIDAMTIARKCRSETTFDINPSACAALRHNAKALGINNLTVINANSIEWLAESDTRFNTIFVDPARRGTGGDRKYALEDCSPDVIANLDTILSHCDRLIIKASPMLDITEAIRLLPITELYIVEHKGECKEVLMIVKRNSKPERIAAVRLPQNRIIEGNIEPCTSSAIADTSVDIQEYYLYEPSAAVCKLGAYYDISSQYPDIQKLAQNTLVYISKTLYKDFPGRILKIDEVNPKSNLKGVKLNIVCRNYPLTPQQLQKKLRTKDGGTQFLYGVTVGKKPTLLLCSPIDF